ncbi:MAG: fused MFS/spermidine synthase [Chitinivibrionia bacterium]|nr:fused MFS/spermidine synthase [Chitinivibrionia bacterium]
MYNSAMMNCYIYFAVIVCGASVLAIEILGTRLIGPFYGVSLYLWSALIGVTLAALSAGYAIGGRLADRGPKLGRFSLLIGLSGLWISANPWLRPPVLAATETVGLRAAVLITAIALFFPPLALLGMISPYAIRLKAAHLDEVGRTAGNLYALSTVASVVAAVGTGFFLIPNMGVSALTFLIGILLIVTAILGFAIGRKRPAATAALLAAVIIAACGFLAAPAENTDPDGGLLALHNSGYAEIRVVDLDGRRFMLIDGGSHTIVDAETFEAASPHVNVLDIPRFFFDKPGAMLLIGLGGGSVVKHYALEDWAVSAVEIDPAVTRIAYEYFGLQSSEAAVFHADGRRFLIDHGETYDIIILDAFGSSSIPFHLVTKESFGLIKSRLRPDGLVAVNVEAVGWNDAIVRSLAATLETQFAHVCALPIAEPPNQLGNVILLASDRELELADEPPVPRDRFSAEYDRAHAWDNRFEADVSGGAPVRTDEYNPVDIWAERINLVSRTILHEYFGSHGMAW